jgi:uncharacterized repeat protein (TIGR01451 family)/CSLREA domain-containing protein
MSRPSMPRACLRVSLLLAALAGCQDPTDPRVGMQPRSSQGNLATWTVNSLADPGDGTCDDTECTLREAMAAAASGDAIGFESGLQGDIKLTAGQLEISVKSLTIDGGGRIAVDAQGNSRVLSVTAIPFLPPDVTLARITLKNGSHIFGGGGLSLSSATVTLDSVTVSNNQANQIGGGILVVSNDNDANVTIRNSTISGNIAGADVNHEGGGVYIDQGSSVTLINSTVDNNEAGFSGGGIANLGDLTVTASTISGNEGPVAGGIFNAAGGNLTVVQSTISGNRGPGINSIGTLDLRSSTLSRNVGAVGLRSVGPTTVANSIIAGNSGTLGIDCALGSDVTSLGHNLRIAGGGCSFSASGDVQIDLAQVFTEVIEADLKDSGGLMKTHALIARGRAADAGYCPGETTDQRGFARPVDDPAMPDDLDACDIGAYELQGPVAVVADLMISQAVNKTSVKQGELLTYFIRVQNLGPEAAPNVVVTNLLSSGVTFVEARHNKGTHTAPPRGETGTVTWSLGDLLDQANEVAEITVTVLVKGRTTITNTASVTGDVADPNEANNSAAIRVSVASGTGGKGGGKK